MLIDQLRNNKGTVSSKLGKELAIEVLAGDEELLQEAVSLISFEKESAKSKNIRAGAAKIVEKVAEKAPEMVAPFLSEMLDAFEVDEPQTRWMLMMIFGYCASLNCKVAETGIEYSKIYLEENAGVCLSGAAELYLGNMGTVSKEYANRVLPILLDAYHSVIGDEKRANEIDWVFEAFMMIVKYLSPEQKKVVLTYAEDYSNPAKKSTLKRRGKLIKLAQV